MRFPTREVIIRWGDGQYSWLPGRYSTVIPSGILTMQERMLIWLAGVLGRKAERILADKDNAWYAQDDDRNLQQ